MAININKLGNNTPVSQNLKQQANAQVKAEQANVAQQAKPARQDSVSLTPQAKQMSELQKKDEKGPEINQKKVAELKKAIEAGDYKIDPQKLAASIAKFEFDLI
jgi:negative regulator of flagellin synthesis FlgM